MAAKKIAKTAKKAAKNTAKKTAPKNSTPAPTSSPVIAAAPSSIRVRMYRQGLGDCFLLTCSTANGDARHVLIDCGTLGAKTTGNALADIVSHIAETTGKSLDAMIATHEHWDHVSGFATQQEKFKAFAVREVWLAWTENPQDELAQRIAKIQKDLGAALGAAADVLTGEHASPDSRDVGLTVRSLLGFNGPEAEQPLGAAEIKETLDAAMQFVRTGYPAARVQYFTPGQVIEPAWLPGFRFYVLGPPRNEDALGDLGDHGSSELYGMAAGLRSAALFHASGQTLDQYGKLHAASGESDALAQELPFDATVRVEKDDARVKQWFEDSYFDKTNDWRRIDDDWLLGAADLALQLDSLTNNTSLALALERIADGKVLLLAADAQQGNWLSWHGGVHDLPALTWTVSDANGATRTVTAADLLSRAVFYKVGHHGSHNATARGKGLELMTRRDELTAFIPVDRAVALTRNPQGAWRMPAVPLYRALLEHCNGRVVRSDTGWAAPSESAANPTTEAAFVDLATKNEWTTWKTSQDAAVASGGVKIDPLFIDYTLA